MESLPAESPPVVSASISDSSNPLLRVCALLNEHNAEYVVIGAWAMILHNVVRATEDVDILVAPHRDNFQRIISALSQLEDAAASELSPSDFEENIIIKIADEVEVDVSTQAWTVTYDQAFPKALRTEIDGVVIPYLSLQDLIASKQTPQHQDRADVERLQRLL